jgi:protoheme IX farnesyltransferase
MQPPVSAWRHAAANYVVFSNAMIGIAPLSSGIATLNQYMERDLRVDVTYAQAFALETAFYVGSLFFGVALTLEAEALAVFVNAVTAMLGLTVIAGYLFVYTPLKTRTSLSTMVGVSRRGPAADWLDRGRGDITLESLVLFAILFLWQFLHFLAIA